MGVSEGSVEDLQVYVETNVLRFFDDAVSDPRPPAQRAEDAATAINQVAATRMFLYARARRWRLWISGTARAELQARDRRRGRDDWTVPLYEDLDERSDAPSAELVAATAERYRLQFGLSEKRQADMRHLARVVLLPWIEVFVTNDKRLAGWTRRALEPKQRAVRIYTTAEAEHAMKLQPEEQPPTKPAPGHPLLAATRPWWIP
jgi:hypothetical protein